PRTPARSPVPVPGRGVLGRRSPPARAGLSDPEDIVTTTATTAAKRPRTLAEGDFRVADLSLAGFGRVEIRLAEHEMPGWMAVRGRREHEPRRWWRRDVAGAPGRAVRAGRCGAGGGLGRVAGVRRRAGGVGPLPGRGWAAVDAGRGRDPGGDRGDHHGGAPAVRD